MSFVIDINYLDAKKFEESKHPRDDSGQFGSGGGGGELHKTETIKADTSLAQPARSPARSRSETIKTESGNVYVNPPLQLLLRVMDKDSENSVRIVCNGEDFSASSAMSNTHDDMVTALVQNAHPMGEGLKGTVRGEEADISNDFLYIQEDPDGTYTSGRHRFEIRNQEYDEVPPEYLPSGLRRVLGVTGDTMRGITVDVNYVDENRTVHFDFPPDWSEYYIERWLHDLAMQGAARETRESFNAGGSFYDEFTESDHPRGPGGRFGLTSHEVKALGNFTFSASKAARSSPHLTSAMGKLPVHKGTVHRGMLLNPKTIASFKVGSQVSFPSHSSSSSDPDVASMYALESSGSEGLRRTGNTPVLMHIRQHSGARIPSSLHPEGSGMKEVILRGGTRYHVLGIKHDQEIKSIGSKPTKGTIVHLAEMLTHDDFKEEQHPRGQPENAGEFVKGAGSKAPTPVTHTGRAPPGKGGGSLTRAPADRSEWPENIKKLKVPPAWQDVHINQDPEGALQVMGYAINKETGSERWQPLYHPRFVATQSEAKFSRIKEMESKFDSIVAQNDKARNSNDPVVREHADVAALIISMGLRPGGDETDAANKSYGAVTLQGRHVIKSANGSVWLKFVPGKKHGETINLKVDDPSIAKMLLDRKAKGGTAYTTPLFPNVNSHTLLNYFHSFDGGGFKSKDARTLLGTRTALTSMDKMKPPTDPVMYKKAVKAVADVVAAKLGNTAAVAVTSYIDPTVWAAWRKSAGV